MRLRLRVKEVAQQKGVSMTRLGRLAAIHRLQEVNVTFYQPEGDFNLSTLTRLATALNVHVCDLLEEIPD